ncbi:MAG: FHA domain-containing protein [Lachnospiraceae bacterium]|nr:FHA domain-containing protein [Lachnospiraceae bacterium]
MLETEYVRNLNCNYVRLRLQEKPEDNRYQYCILNRGGIRYLLPCSLRYINGDAFLYYDISSTQSMVQMFETHTIKRDWMEDFLWGMERMQQELGRYLLEEHNVIWNPAHIYQDLEKNDFCFLYVPYYQGETGLKQLLDFWVEHIDYEDEALVEFVYGLHEQYDTAGDVCLQGRILEKFRELEEKQQQALTAADHLPEPELPLSQENAALPEPEPASIKKGLLSFLERRRKKQETPSYQEILQRQVSMQTLGAVCEEIAYDAGQEEEYGKTVYMEEQREQIRGLYRENGELAIRIEKLPFVIGKKKEEADYVLEDRSVSRIHARILEENGSIYLEDLNSTNGTFKNGLRMQPYEKRRLEKNDELCFGKVEFVFR